MILLELLYFVVLCLFVLFMVTQLIIPVFQRTPLFPDFRKEKAEVLDELAHVNEELELKELKEEVKHKKEML